MGRADGVDRRRRIEERHDRQRRGGRRPKRPAPGRRAVPRRRWLRFDGDEAAAVTRSDDTQAGGMRWDNTFGRDNYGPINQAGRDVNIQSWHTHRHAEEDPSDELFQGRGFGRVLILVGSIVALAGFAGWMYVILSGFGSTGEDSPFDMKVVGLPLAGVAFAAFLGGGILSGIGTGMSRAARARAERSDAFADVRFHPPG
jgi:hypothetical protein